MSGSKPEELFSHFLEALKVVLAISCVLSSNIPHGALAVFPHRTTTGPARGTVLAANLAVSAGAHLKRGAVAEVVRYMHNIRYSSLKLYIGSFRVGINYPRRVKGAMICEIGKFVSRGFQQ